MDLRPGDLPDDGDVVRGLGYVTMYSATVEEDVDDILRQLVPIEPFDEKIQRWPISRKLEHAAKLVEQLQSDEVETLPNALRAGIALFEERNYMIHGRIYVDRDKKVYIQSGRPNVPIKELTSTELYKLANKFYHYRDELIGPQEWRLPNAINAAVNR